MCRTVSSRGDLTYSHARELLVLKDNSQISKLATLAVKKRMSVLQLEDEVMNVAIPQGPDEDRASEGRRRARSIRMCGRRSGRWRRFSGCGCGSGIARARGRSRSSTGRWRILTAWWEC